MIEVINEIIKKHYADIGIDIEEDTKLRSKFTIAIDKNQVICNDIDEIFNDSEQYFIFYKNENLSSKQIDNSILEKIEQSNINQQSKFSYVNLYIIFNKMQDKLIFDKYKKENNFKKKILNKIKEKGCSLMSKDIELNTIFIGNNNNESFSIEIYDRIRSLENYRKIYIDERNLAGLEINGYVFNAKLKDIVNIYDTVGNKLFDKNLRYSIKDELEVDLHIKKTLKENPDEFWYLNNGITMIIEDDDFKLRKSKSIDINYNSNTTISIINGAQTISAAASYIYQDDVNKDIDAKVIFRVIHIRTFEQEDNNSLDIKEFRRNEINKISIALNRQKPIKQEDIAYTTSFVDMINQLSEIHDEEYYFKIGKRSKEISEEYDLLNFAKIVMSYLCQQPGDALTKGAKSLLQINNGELLNNDIFKYDFEDDENFKIYYKPVNFASILMNKYIKYSKEIAKSLIDGSLMYAKENINNISSYGKLYFIAYIVYVLNDYNNNDFSNFNIKNIKDDEVKEIIKEYMELFNYFIINNKGLKNGISINEFKKNDLYKEFRDYDEEDEIGRRIKEFNSKLHVKFK